MTEIASFSSYKEGELDNMKQRVENVARIGGIVEETRQEMAQMRQQVGIQAAAKFAVILNDHKEKIKELSDNTR